MLGKRIRGIASFMPSLSGPQVRTVALAASRSSLSPPAAVVRCLASTRLERNIAMLNLDPLAIGTLDVARAVEQLQAQVPEPVREVAVVGSSDYREAVVDHLPFASSQFTTRRAYEEVAADLPTDEDLTVDGPVSGLDIMELSSVVHRPIKHSELAMSDCKDRLCGMDPVKVMAMFQVYAFNRQRDANYLDLLLELRRTSPIVDRWVHSRCQKTVYHAGDHLTLVDVPRDENTMVFYEKAGLSPADMAVEILMCTRALR